MPYTFDCVAIAPIASSSRRLAEFGNFNGFYTNRLHRSAWNLTCEREPMVFSFTLNFTTFGAINCTFDLFGILGTPITHLFHWSGPNLARESEFAVCCFMPNFTFISTYCCSCGAKTRKRILSVLVPCVAFTDHAITVSTWCILPRQISPSSVQPGPCMG